MLERIVVDERSAGSISTHMVNGEGYHVAHTAFFRESYTIRLDQASKSRFLQAVGLYLALGLGVSGPVSEENQTSRNAILPFDP